MVEEGDRAINRKRRWLWTGTPLIGLPLVVLEIYSHSWSFILYFKYQDQLIGGDSNLLPTNTPLVGPFLAFTGLSITFISWAEVSSFIRLVIVASSV